MSNLQRDVYLRSDINNALKAIKNTNEAVMRRLSSPEGNAYRDGFNAALESVALAFNIDSTQTHVVDVTVESNRKRLQSGTL